MHRARELGYAVGSAHGEGYYLIQNEAELSMTIAHIERRIPGLRHTVRLLRSAWERQIEEE